jgi:uncharacterized protein
MPHPPDWLLTAERVAVHRPSRTAVVADLHLGYAEARRRRGEAVPNDCVARQLRPLSRVLQRQDVRRLVIAGDLLEEGHCRDALAQFEQWLHQNEVDEVIVVPGNHDVNAGGVRRAEGAGRTQAEEVTLGEWRVVHGDGVLPSGPIVQGHEHPYLRWSPKRNTIRPPFAGSRIASPTIEGPCYLIGPGRLILPAFSDEAAGVNILSSRRWRAYRCLAIAEDRVLDLGEVATLRGRLAAALGVRPLAD